MKRTTYKILRALGIIKEYTIIIHSYSVEASGGTYYQTPKNIIRKVYAYSYQHAADKIFGKYFAYYILIIGRDLKEIDIVTGKVI